MPNFKVTIIPAGDGPVSIHDMKGDDGPSFKEIYPLIMGINNSKFNFVKCQIKVL